MAGASKIHFMLQKFVMGLARKKKLNCLEGGDHDLFKNHKWPRLSCVHYTKWHFVLKFMSTVIQGHFPDHSSAQSHKQLDGGSAGPLPVPTPGQATLICFISVMIPSVAFCCCPSSPVSTEQIKGMFPHCHVVMSFPLL